MRVLGSATRGSVVWTLAELETEMVFVWACIVAYDGGKEFAIHAFVQAEKSSSLSWHDLTMSSNARDESLLSITSDLAAL